MCLISEAYFLYKIFVELFSLLPPNDWLPSRSHVHILIMFIHLATVRIIIRISKPQLVYHQILYFGCNLLNKSSCLLHLWSRISFHASSNHHCCMRPKNQTANKLVITVFCVFPSCPAFLFPLKIPFLAVCACQPISIPELFHMCLHHMMLKLRTLWVKSNPETLNANVC